jgi:hypothetical protein
MVFLIKKKNNNYIFFFFFKFRFIKECDKNKIINKKKYKFLNFYL